MIQQQAVSGVKILYWDRDGFTVWAKRLERGTYAMPFGDNGEVRREITAQELGALLSGHRSDPGGTKETSPMPHTLTFPHFH